MILKIGRTLTALNLTYFQTSLSSKVFLRSGWLLSSCLWTERSVYLWSQRSATKFMDYIMANYFMHASPWLIMNARIFAGHFNIYQTTDFFIQKWNETNVKIRFWEMGACYGKRKTRVQVYMEPYGDYYLNSTDDSCCE